MAFVGVGDTHGNRLAAQRLEHDFCIPPVYWSLGYRSNGTLCPHVAVTVMVSGAGSGVSFGL